MSFEGGFFLVFGGLIGLIIVISLINWVIEYTREEQHLTARINTLTPEVATLTSSVSIAQTLHAQITEVIDALRTEDAEITNGRAEMSHLTGLAASFRTGQAKGGAGQRAFEITQLAHTRDLLRLRNQIAGARDYASLRPLRVDAQRARLKAQADYKHVDAEMARQAREQVAAGWQPNGGADPLASGAAAFADFVERQKCDGADVADLEEALRVLREAAAGGRPNGGV